jgi:hypothetical protein
MSGDPAGRGAALSGALRFGAAALIVVILIVVWAVAALAGRVR